MRILIRHTRIVDALKSTKQIGKRSLTLSFPEFCVMFAVSQVNSSVFVA